MSRVVYRRDIDCQIICISHLGLDLYLSCLASNVIAMMPERAGTMPISKFQRIEQKTWV